MDYNKYEEFPILYGIEKNGKVKIWKASVYYNDNDKAVSSIEFGQIDGKKQVATREYTEGKNIGKKNETTPLQQCINETRKKWVDKRDKESYKESIRERHSESHSDSGASCNERLPCSASCRSSFSEGKDGKEEKEVENKSIPLKDDEKFFPMLAHTYEPDTNKNKKNNIIFPCYVQPKLDGLRCIMYYKGGVIKCQSRTGAYFDTMSHITDELDIFFKNNNIVLDGELYTNEMPFEELAGIIKKKKLSHSDREKLKNVKYHVYDIIDSEKPYSERYKDISRHITLGNYKYVLSVLTNIANTKEDFKQYFGEFIVKGYEGIMLRNVNGLYRCNYRSHDLQKYKEFKEDEYTIVGFKEGDGRDKGTVIWICKTIDKEFSVRPKGTMENRRELFNNGDSYVGKKLTVIYQELSELGIPRFPVGKDIRQDY